MQEPMMMPIEASNLLQAYSMDPMLRERCNDKGLYINTQGKNTACTLYLTSEIEDSSYYHEFLEICACLEPTDSIILIIDSPGGYLSGAQMITKALDSTLAESTAVVIDMAASAASILAISCDELIMHSYSHMMIHTMSFGSGGKSHEIQSHTEFTLRKAKEYIREIYGNFLTSAEIEDVIKGGDIYLDDEQVAERWGVLQALKSIERKEAEQEYLKEYLEDAEARVEQLKGMIKPKVTPMAKPQVAPVSKPKSKPTDKADSKNK